VAAGVAVDGGSAACCVAVGPAAALDGDGGVTPAAEDDPADCGSLSVAVGAGAVDSVTVDVAAAAGAEEASFETEVLEVAGAAATEPEAVVELPVPSVAGTDVEPAAVVPACVVPVPAAAPVF
jgi:hypothetical protein